MKSIYLDHAATTYVYPEVWESMLPYQWDHFGNASSIHQFGRSARLTVENARESIAQCLKCDTSSLIFTSGATESINSSLFGVAFAHMDQKPHIIISAIEHQAVIQTAAQLSRLGATITVIPVNSQGFVELEQLKQAVTDRTLMICVMAGNNEVGTLQSIAQIGHFAREKGIYFLVDAVQALGWIPIEIDQLPVDMMAFSAHKIHGPKGIGLLYLSRNVKLLPHLYGGSQERKRRAGTENVPSIVGFSTAVQMVIQQREQRTSYVKALRDELLQKLKDKIGSADVIYNGHSTNTLPHILNVSFPWMETETMLMNLDLAGIAVASGSACSSGSFEPSHVLKAMNLEKHIMNSAIRFSFAESNTTEEIDQVVQVIASIYERCKQRVRKG